MEALQNWSFEDNLLVFNRSSVSFCFYVLIVAPLMEDLSLGFMLNYREKIKKCSQDIKILNHC